MSSNIQNIGIITINMFLLKSFSESSVNAKQDIGIRQRDSIIHFLKHKSKLVYSYSYVRVCEFMNQR